MTIDELKQAVGAMTPGPPWDVCADTDYMPCILDEQGMEIFVAGNKYDNRPTVAENATVPTSPEKPDVCGCRKALEQLVNYPDGRKLCELHALRLELTQAQKRIAELESPAPASKCKTCGGSEKIPVLGRHDDIEDRRCPDCTGGGKQ